MYLLLNGTGRCCLTKATRRPFAHEKDLYTWPRSEEAPNDTIDHQPTTGSKQTKSPFATRVYLKIKLHFASCHSKQQVNSLMTWLSNLHLVNRSKRYIWPEVAKSPTKLVTFRFAFYSLHFAFFILHFTFDSLVSCFVLLFTRVHLFSRISFWMINSLSYASTAKAFKI